MRRGAQSTSTPFPFDIPVIGWARSGFDDSEMERVRLRTVILHDGWLFKRAQITLASRRWYVLENYRLYSYTRQDYLQGEDIDPSFPQFPASIRAVIDLEHCGIKVISKQKLLLEIQCEERFCWSKKGNFFSDLGSGLSSSSKTFTFYAEDDTAFQSWVDVLSRVEAYKKLKLQLQFSTQPRPEPLTLWDLPRESLLRTFCRMPDDKSEFKYFEKKWPPLREEDVMFYRRVVLLLNGSHQRAMDRHKQVALQEWEVNNSWKEVFEHITLNKLTSEPVIEVEYNRLEMKLPAENSTLVLKVKERMEIFVDYKAIPRILLRSLKELQDLRVERLLADLDIEQWLLKVEPFLTRFCVPVPNGSTTATTKPKDRAKGAAAASPQLVITTEEDIIFARLQCDRGVDIVDSFLAQVGSSLLLEDGPCCEKGLFKKLYQGVIVKLIDVQREEGDNPMESPEQALQQHVDIDLESEFHMNPDDVDDFFDKSADPAPLAAKVSKDMPHAPELFSDWEGGALAVEPLTFVTFLSKLHGLAKALRGCEVEMQNYFSRIYENLLKKDKTSDDIKGFRPSTMKKDDHVQHLPINGHVQTVAYRSLKSKGDESARPDAVMQKISSFITVGAFSAHALKFKSGKGYDGELKSLAKLVESLDKHIENLHVDSDLWLKAVNGDEPSVMELNSRIDESVDLAMATGPVGSNSSARLKKKLDSMISCVWKLFGPGLKNDWSIPEILKARCELQKRRSVSISQALASFAEVIMNQIKTFYHGSSPDFWYILDLIGAFTLTVSCLVSVFHEEMGMLDDTYNACRWVIDRRLMIRLKLMPQNMHTEHDSDFFWTLCEEPDSAGSKSSRNQGDAASSYNMLFRYFPCEKKEEVPKKKDEHGPCLCRVCRSHPLPQWDEKRVDEDYPAYFQSYRAKAAPADFLQPVLVIHVRKKYWDRIPPFVLDPSDPTHLRFDYPLFPIFNNVGINENQRRAAVQSPLNFLMQNRVNTDAAAVFVVSLLSILSFYELTLSPFSEHDWCCRTQLQSTVPRGCSRSASSPPSLSHSPIARCCSRRRLCNASFDL